jgi:hypothetical protein
MVIPPYNHFSPRQGALKKKAGRRPPSRQDTKSPPEGDSSADYYSAHVLNHEQYSSIVISKQEAQDHRLYTLTQAYVLEKQFAGKNIVIYGSYGFMT